MHRTLLSISVLLSLIGGGKSYAAPYQSNSEKVSVQQQSDEHTQCTGIVTDAQGEPIVGASIRIKGTSIGAVTDVNGKFVIKKGVTNQASLVVTYLGYEDQTVKWNGKPMNIVLAEKSKALEGVVVTGIFERKKEGLTGSAKATTCFPAPTQALCPNSACADNRVWATTLPMRQSLCVAMWTHDPISHSSFLTVS